MSERSRLKRANGEGDGGPSEETMSEVEEAGDVAEGEGFRVSVDLSAYWGMPAACLVWVPRGRRRVRWLARRVRAAAALRRRFLLLAAARALPPAEPLRLLAHTDRLCVVPVEHEWQRPFSFPAASPPASPSSPRPCPSPSPSPELLTEAVPVQVAVLKKKKKRKREETIADAPPLAVDVPPLENTVPERNEALQSVKQRALALLERVSSQADAGDGGAGRDEPDAEWDQPPLKKRRRRVRRRRAKALESWTPGPVEPFEERRITNFSEFTVIAEVTEPLPFNREESPGPAKPAILHEPPVNEERRITTFSEFTVIAEVTEPLPCNLEESPGPAAVHFEPPALPVVPFEPPAVPNESPAVPLEPLGPSVVRNASVPRAPRLVRALSSEAL